MKTKTVSIKVESRSSSLNRETRTVQSLLSQVGTVMRGNIGVSLLSEVVADDRIKKNIDQEKVLEIDRRFEQEYPELRSRLQSFLQESDEFNALFEKIKIINIKKNVKKRIITEPEMYLIALACMDKNYSANDLAVLIPRLRATKTNQGFTFTAADKNVTAEIFNRKLVTVQEAKDLYGGNVASSRHEVVLAGGDATRYLLVLKALKSLSDSLSVIDQGVLSGLSSSNAYKDVKKLFTYKNLATVFNTPMFTNVGYNSELLKTAGMYDVKKVKVAVNTVLDKFENTPKALNYAYRVDVGNQSTYLTFFMNTLLRTYAKVDMEGSSGNVLHYMVHNQTVADSMDNMVQALINAKLLDPAKLDIKFMTRPKDGMAVDPDTRQLLLNDKNIPDPKSAGHGPAYTKAVNELVSLKDVSDNVSFSIRTVDNSGSDVSTYTAYIQNGCVKENQLRDELLTVIRSNNKKAFQELLAKSEYGIDVTLYDMDNDLNLLVAQFIDDRWDFEVSSSEDIAAQIENLPISIAVVVDPLPIHKGGGLYVEDGTGRMSITDKRDLLPNTDEKDVLFKFSPMVYGSLVKQEMDSSMEDGLVFVATKSKGESYIQGESASTHLATSHDRVMKRIISVPKEDLETAFIQQKTIDESSENNNLELSRKLCQDIERMAAQAGIPAEEAARLINAMQEKAILMTKIV
ncbi:MAG TPA: hypothetical protein DCS13_07295 [Candidatus Margulisbacteria bacterium]|nr:MAG: hypothetical protein A2X43_01310 [Candidatus Margulisbacteria bacterium GWD2_39_127]HAR63252.1 hypothetical protein [Candidatus Margulisiibacteriota bacterium]